MVKHQSYSASVFHGIPSLHECNAGFHSKGGTEFLTMHLRPLIRAYGYEERYGVGLVHKHFEIKPDEILVEYQSITAPWKVRTNYHGATIRPTAWAFTGDEMIPYEFEFVPQSEDKEDDLGSEEKHAKFLDAFNNILDAHDLQGFLGLCRFPGARCDGYVELTEGRANIKFRPSEVRHKCSTSY
jgi:hypothetical protein